MKSKFAVCLSCLLLAFCMQSNSAMAQTLTPLTSQPATWPQWGQNPQHAGMVNVAGDTLDNQAASSTYDPFVPQEQAANSGELLAHYQAPLVDGNGKLYMVLETGTFDPNNAKTRTWNEQKLNLSDGHFTVIWNFASDWYPEDPAQLGGWEPVFSPALAGSFVYVPGSNGTVWKLNASDGTVASHIDPFNDGSGNIFVSSPLTADSTGNIYYNAIHFTDATNFLGTDVVDSWVVKISTNGTASKVSYSVLVPNPPTSCEGVFAESQLPWPPSPTAVPPQGFTCGTQRPGINVSPAIGTDGTIYTVSRAHFNSRYPFMIAINPNLTPKWATSMRMLFNDGCGVLIPIQSRKNVPEKGKCNFGAPIGVEPETNHAGTARVIDQSSSTPTVLPDGVLYGAYSRYNIARGHLVKFDFSGHPVANFDFGWDSTPAVYSHSGTYSIVIKDNHYDEEAGFYCNPDPSVPVSLTVCDSTGIPAGPFYITQLSPSLVPQWKFHNINFNQDPTGHPNGYEWCINAPAVDASGFVYVNSEDGNMYRIPQGHTGVFDISTAGQMLFLKVAIGAAYTPLSIGPDGTIYTENDGVLIAVR